jgi:hypothetical protein
MASKDITWFFPEIKFFYSRICKRISDPEKALSYMKFSAIALFIILGLWSVVALGVFAYKIYLDVNASKEQIQNYYVNLVVDSVYAGFSLIGCIVLGLWLWKIVQAWRNADESEIQEQFTKICNPDAYITQAKEEGYALAKEEQVAAAATILAQIQANSAASVPTPAVVAPAPTKVEVTPVVAASVPTKVAAAPVEVTTAVVAPVATTTVATTPVATTPVAKPVLESATPVPASTSTATPVTKTDSANGQYALKYFDGQIAEFLAELSGRV